MKYKVGDIIRPTTGSGYNIEVWVLGPSPCDDLDARVVHVKGPCTGEEHNYCLDDTEFVRHDPLELLKHITEHKFT